MTEDSMKKIYVIKNENFKKYSNLLAKEFGIDTSKKLLEFLFYEDEDNKNFEIDLEDNKDITALSGLIRQLKDIYKIDVDVYDMETVKINM